MTAATALVTAGKVASTAYKAGIVANAISNADSPENLLPFLLLMGAQAAGVPTNTASLAGAEGALPFSDGSNLSKAVHETLNDKGQVIINIPAEQTANDHNMANLPSDIKADGNGDVSITLHTVDEKYVRFGNVRDLVDTIMSGSLPSAHSVYLALLDIIDYVDMGLFGDEITMSRLQDHMHEQKVTIRTRTHIEHKITPEQKTISHESGSRETGDFVHTSDRINIDNDKTISQQGDIEAQIRETKVTISTDGGPEEHVYDAKVTASKETTITQRTDIEKQNVTVDRRLIEDVTNKQTTDAVTKFTTTVQENGGPVQVLDQREIRDNQVTIENIHTEKQKRTFWGWLKGEAVQSTTTVSGSADVSREIEVLDTSTGKMVLVDSSSEHTDLAPQTQQEREWKSGIVSYVPMVGTGLDLTLKHYAGFEISKGDWAQLGVDAVLTVTTMGVGAIAAKTAVKATAMTVAKKVTAQVANKALACSAPVGKISGARAAIRLADHYKHLGKVWSPERIIAKNAANVHNPMRVPFLKSLEQLKRLEESGVNIKTYLRNEFKGHGPLGPLRAKNLEAQFRLAKQKGLFTAENRQLLAQGKSPLNKFGEKMDVDHIIPKSLQNSLKADPLNLSLLEHSANISKSNKIPLVTRRRLMDIKKYDPQWKPEAALEKKINEMRLQMNDANFEDSFFDLWGRTPLPNNPTVS